MATTDTKYAGIRRAQLSYDYLHTNSTTHEFLFGAIVELVDNARDAGAKRIDIFTEKDATLRGRVQICFLDNGCGMTRDEATGVMTFGYSAKKFDPSMIGQYGNGLKSGAMRIGKDFILFTKKNDVMTCVFLSRTFHEDEHIEEVLVPSPSFTLDKRPLVETDEEQAKHTMEMDLIYKYSPFKNEKSLMGQFDRLAKSESGTLIICYNLRLLDTGESEIDINTDPVDLRLAGVPPDIKEVPERMSLRAYLSIIYAFPRMKVYIQGKRVQTRRLVSVLYKPKQYKFLAKNFKARAEKEAAKAREDARLAEQRLMEAKSKFADFQARHNTSYATDPVIRAEYRQLQMAASQLETQSAEAKKRAEMKEKSKNSPAPLNFVFGLNLERRGHFGCMIYNNGRLIRMYEPVGPQKDGGVKGLGVIGVVDIPYVILEPTHNKQAFADQKEYTALLRAMGEHLEQYWKDLNLAAQSGGVPRFWEQYGYTGTDWAAPPSNEEQCRTRRLMSTNLCVQCDLCLKWRELPFQRTYLKNYPSDEWTCAKNPNKQFSSCDKKEEFEKITTGKLEKATDLDDPEEQQKLEKKIAQQKKKLEEMEKVKQKATTSAESSRKNKKDVSPPVADRRISAPIPKKSPARLGRRPPPRTPTPPPKKPKTKADLIRQQQEKDAAALKKKSDLEKKKKKEAEEKKKKLEEVVSRRAAVVNRKRVIDDDEDTDEEEEEQEEEVAPRPKRTRAPPSPAVPAVVTSSKRGSANGATGATPVRAAADTSHEDSVEAPSASVQSSPTKVTAAMATDNGQGVKLLDMMRGLLVFFRPPEYILTKRELQTITAERLAALDMHDFESRYETGLKKLVENHQKSAESAKKDLNELRKNVLRLLASLKIEGHDSLDNCSSSVDALLRNTLDTLDSDKK